MKLTELEQRIKADFDENEFSPKEGDWERMQQALKPKRSSVLLLLPFSKAVAAAAVLVALGTSGLYLFFSPAGKQGSVARSAPTPSKPAIQAPQVAVHKPEKEEQAPYPGFSGFDRARVQPGKTNTQNIPVPQDKPAGETYTALAEQEAPQTGQPVTPLSPEEPRYTPPLRGNTTPNYNPYQVSPGNTLRLGLAAGVGKPTLGNVQYNLSVVARQPLGNRFFAEANVSLSSGNINYSEKSAAPPSGGGGGGGNGIPTDGVNNTPDPVSLNYVSNIISVGVAPSLGYKITSNLSVSGGADVYKALNRDLKFQPGNMPADKSYGLPIPQRSITDWDFGLKAQAEFRLNKNFSFSTQYRQGLTQYILIDGRSLKNSNFTLGLKYYMLKVR